MHVLAKIDLLNITFQFKIIIWSLWNSLIQFLIIDVLSMLDIVLLGTGNTMWTKADKNLCTLEDNKQNMSTKYVIC